MAKELRPEEKAQIIRQAIDDAREKKGHSGPRYNFFRPSPLDAEAQELYDEYYWQERAEIDAKKRG